MFSGCETFRNVQSVPHEVRFVDSQESRIQVANRSDMGNGVMKGLRFGDTQESCFEAWKRSHMGLPPCYVVDLMMLRNCVINLEKVQIWAVPTCKGVYL